MTNQPTDPQETCRLLYDGACPMCSAFAAYADKTHEGALIPIDARAASALRNQATAKGFDLDTGIVVEVGGTLIHGADALAYLALRRQDTIAYRLLTLPFRSPWVSRRLYPVLVGCRRLLLWLGGKSLIRNLVVKPH